MVTEQSFISPMTFKFLANVAHENALGDCLTYTTIIPLHTLRVDWISFVNKNSSIYSTGPLDLLVCG